MRRVFFFLSWHRWVLKALIVVGVGLYYKSKNQKSSNVVLLPPASWYFSLNIYIDKNIHILLTISSSNLSSVEDLCKLEYLPPSAYYWINSLCYLQRTFRAFEWCQMWRGRALVPFSSSFRKMAAVSTSTFYVTRKSKCIIRFIEQILAWNVVGIFYISLLTTH